MSLLLHGIVNENALLTMPTDLKLIRAAGLMAVVQGSEAEACMESDVILAYGQRVMDIHQQTTLIPMRYGSILADEKTVVQHLIDKGRHYIARLSELDGCDEMGIRLFIDPIDSAIDISPAMPGGQAYLLSRKRAYAISEYTEQQVAILATALSGLYRKYYAEISLFNGNRTYLLSYLVPRGNLEKFRECLNNLGDNNTAARFISGPWPPYNFAN